MSRPLRLLIVFAVLVVLAFVIGFAVRIGQSPPATVAVAGVPAAARQGVRAALAQAGYPPGAPPVWAGTGAAWRAPGRYRLFFSGPRSGGGTDIFSADARVDSNGQVAEVARIAHVSDTPAGDEDTPVLAGEWLAFATRVGQDYQSVACLRLADPAGAEVFTLERPAGRVQLEWQSRDNFPVLSVQAAWAARSAGPETAATMIIDPVARSVIAGEAGLAYQPAVKGEQAWLPALVSRVRELPGIGPEKIAFLENVFFTAQDGVTRLLHPVPQARVQPAPASPMPGLPTAVPPLPVAAVSLPTAAPATPVPAASPSDPLPTTRVPGPLATAISSSAGVPTASPSAAPATAPPSPAPLPTARTVPPTSPPPPTLSPAVPPQMAAAAGQLPPDGLAMGELFNPDLERPYATAEAVTIDPGLLQLKMIHGTWEPVSTTGLSGGAGMIPEGDRAGLVAAFNGGFAAMHGQYGMMVDRKVYLPPRDGIATVAVYEDGSIRMGTWGKDLRQTSDMVSFRQNCPPLIENGTITAETGKLTLWGLSVSNAVYLYRSGLGVTADGRLVYVAGKPLSAYTLARALQQAGAVYAMQLDVDEYHVVFITYGVQADASGGVPAVSGRKLCDDMHGFDAFFLRPFELDFFYLTRRPERLAAPLRQGPASSGGPAPVPAAVPALPGHIAFASNRDGRWQLYSIPAGQPDQPSQLTQGPADNLYPAWSPDGKHLAFTSRRDGNSEIYVLDMPAGTEQAPGSARRVTQQPSEEWAPAWSPDGSRLAYQSDRNGQSDIYVIRSDGGAETRLTGWQGNNESPHWSADGRLMVFDSDLDVAEAVHASINVYLMGADGSGPRRIISHGESPVLSPDGKTVAFAGQRTGFWGIFVQNVDGTGLRKLSANGYNARYPAWSPDGRWLAFAGDREGHWEIYAVPAEGGEAARLTATSGDSSYPHWGP